MRIPLMGRIGVAFLFVGGALLLYFVYWVPTHPLVVLNKPVSLSPGRITTGEFEVVPGYLYYIEIETDWTTKSFPSGCAPYSALKTRWKLTNISEVYWPEAGESPWEPSGLILDEFHSYTSSYSFEATILPGADCLNAGNPRLLIHTHPQQRDSYLFMIWFSVWCIAIGFVSLIITGLYALSDATRLPRMLPEMALRNILPWKRHAPMPLLKGLPNFGLVMGSFLSVLVFIFITIQPSAPKGLFVSLRSQDSPSWQKTAWPETLAVYVDGRGGFFLNGKRIRREDLGAQLNEELSKRAVWTVYFEADQAIDFGAAAYSIDTIQGLGAKVIWITPKVRKELDEAQQPSSAQR